jgi:hypothetical protein
MDLGDLWQFDLSIEYDSLHRDTDFYGAHLSVHTSCIPRELENSDSQGGD